MKPFHLIPLKYQDFGKSQLNLGTKKAFFQSVKNISVLNVAYSKSVLVLIKNMGVIQLFNSLNGSEIFQVPLVYSAITI